MVCLFLSSLTVVGQSQITTQSQTNVDLKRNFLLEKDSKSEEVTIEVKSGTKRFNLLVTSSISDGKLTIEVYDPSNTKQGNFIVETLPNSDKKEMATGNIKKTLVEPQAGTWRIKIIPSEATGKISILSAAIE